MPSILGSEKENKAEVFSRRKMLLALSIQLGAIGLEFGCSRSSSAEENRLVIFAATSLREAFTSMAVDFKHTQPHAQLSFNFAGTQDLRTQLEHGAAVDIFASADMFHMNELLKTSKVKDSVIFAQNEPVIVVAKENAVHVRSLEDLPQMKRIVVGAPTVPIGRYTLRILDRANLKLGSNFRSNVEAKIVSRELNVRQVLHKVRLGEADAGIVYRTDVRSSNGAVHVVTIPAELNEIADYPIAMVSSSRSKLARLWLDFVTSSDGQRVIQREGFRVPLKGI